MAIAEVKDVRNSVFINGSPAFNGQMIDYDDVIETYDISKGLEESFMSSDQNDDGYLSIEFISENEKKDSMSIKPHCKVIFTAGGAWAGSNTVLLDSKSKYVTLDKSDSKKEKEKPSYFVRKVEGTAWVNGTKPVTVGMGISHGDIVVTEDAFVMLIYIGEGRDVVKIRENTTWKIVDPSKASSIDRNQMRKMLGEVSTAPQGFIIETPVSIASVKG